MDLNLNSAIWTTRAVVPHMRASGGRRIINNASVSAHTAMVGGFTTYEVTKTAMLAFWKSMAIDLAPDNILVNCVCPALILTPLWEKAADSMIPQMGQSRKEVLQRLAEVWLLLKRCAGLRIFGGCCGTDDCHMRALAARMADARKT